MLLTSINSCRHGDCEYWVESASCEVISKLFSAEKVRDIIRHSILDNIMSDTEDSKQRAQQKQKPGEEEGNSKNTDQQTTNNKTDNEKTQNGKGAPKPYIYTSPQASTSNFGQEPTTSGCIGQTHSSNWRKLSTTVMFIATIRSINWTKSSNKDMPHFSSCNESEAADKLKHEIPKIFVEFQPYESILNAEDNGNFITIVPHDVSPYVSGRNCTSLQSEASGRGQEGRQGQTDGGSIPGCFAGQPGARARSSFNPDPRLVLSAITKIYSTKERPKSAKRTYFTNKSKLSEASISVANSDDADKDAYPGNLNAVPPASCSEGMMDKHQDGNSGDAAKDTKDAYTGNFDAVATASCSEGLMDASLNAIQHTASCQNPDAGLPAHADQKDNEKIRGLIGGQSGSGINPQQDRNEANNLTTAADQSGNTLKDKSGNSLNKTSSSARDFDQDHNNGSKTAPVKHRRDVSKDTTNDDVSKDIVNYSSSDGQHSGDILKDTAKDDVVKDIVDFSLSDGEIKANIDQDLGKGEHLKTEAATQNKPEKTDRSIGVKDNDCIDCEDILNALKDLAKERIDIGEKDTKDVSNGSDAVLTPKGAIKDKGTNDNSVAITEVQYRMGNQNSGNSEEKKDGTVKENPKFSNTNSIRRQLTYSESISEGESIYCNQDQNKNDKKLEENSPILVGKKSHIKHKVLHDDGNLDKSYKSSPVLLRKHTQIKFNTLHTEDENLDKGINSPILARRKSQYSINLSGDEYVKSDKSSSCPKLVHRQSQAKLAIGDGKTNHLEKDPNHPTQCLKEPYASSRDEGSKLDVDANHRTIIRRNSQFVLDVRDIKDNALESHWNTSGIEFIQSKPVIDVACNKLNKPDIYPKIVRASSIRDDEPENDDEKNGPKIVRKYQIGRTKTEKNKQQSNKIYTNAAKSPYINCGAIPQSSKRNHNYYTSGIYSGTMNKCNKNIYPAKGPAKKVTRKVTTKHATRGGYEKPDNKKEKGNTKGKDGDKGDGSNDGDSSTDSKKEYFKEELRRLQEGLEKEAAKIVAPPVKENCPYTFNTLEPYYNTHTVKYIIDPPEESKGYQTRQTSIGLCDPWVAHKMDIEMLPKIESKTQTVTEAKKSPRSEKERPAGKAGSTRLPKFPSVKLENDSNATKQMPYNEVPKLREELRQKYSSNSETKINEDYERTKQDFFRMELDKLDEVHPANRDNMKAAYKAYLQNTPGSKKAIQECMKDLEKKDEKNKEK